MPNFITVVSAAMLALLAQHTSFAQTQKSAPPDVIGAAPGAQIVPPAPNYQFPNGRKYVYGVEWHLFNAGTAVVKMEAAGAEQRVSATADSAGAVNVLYAVHDRFESRFDPHTFCSLRITKHTEEGPHKRDTDIHFDYTRRKSVLDEKNLKTGETKHTENDIPSCVTDVITGFYYLASLPLQTGNSYRFVVNDGGKTAEVSARVESHEQVKTPAGTFQTVRVTAEALSGPLMGKGKVWAWFTDDANHTPVQMRAKLGWGTLLFRMQRLEQDAH
jgi:Protein of unknown function (DUF3108)